MKKVFMYSKSRSITLVILILFPLLAGILISLAVCSLIINDFEQEPLAVFLIFTVGALLLIVILIVFWYDGAFTPMYITDDGIKCKNKTLRWDEIKITAYPYVHKAASPYFGYRLLIDKHYLNGAKFIKKKSRHGFCIYLNSNTAKHVVPLILDKISTKVRFLDVDCESEVVKPRLTKKFYKYFEEHNKLLCNCEADKY